MIWAGNTYRCCAQGAKALRHHLADQLGPCPAGLRAGIGHQQAPGFAHRLQHGGQVQGPHAAHVHHLQGQALGRQCTSRQQGLERHE